MGVGLGVDVDRDGLRIYEWFMIFNAMRVVQGGVSG